MVKSVSTVPHVTNFDDADITVLEQMRKSIPKGYLGQDIKLTTMPFVMKAVAASLRQHPVLNASIDDDNEQVVYKEYVNLGIAVGHASRARRAGHARRRSDDHRAGRRRVGSVGR